MPLASGTRLGIYEIVAPLGAGGMGDVYRARDHALGREVAVKVLPARSVADAGQQARLRREARILASLNHPHIAQIYGVADGRAGDSVDPIHGLVLELVPGETLAERLRGRSGRSGLPVEVALKTALEIAAALEAAHARGIVHRDLKPANVKLTSSGAVKVLDFGIAKLVAPEGSEDEAAEAPTRTALTTEGGLLGTPSYMSPEQARGHSVDRRTDIWAFGCLLYELLTGRRAFEGATTADTIGGVLEREPDWERLPHIVPPAVVGLLKRCLRKDPGDRFRDIGDIRLLLLDALEPRSPQPVRRPLAHSVWPWAGGGAAALAAFGVLAFLWSPSSGAGEVVRVSISAPGVVTPQLSATISPEGRRVAFVSTDASGRARLWIRDLDSLQARELPNTERAAHPVWSPEGRSIAFIADAQLRRIDLGDESVRVIASDAVRSAPAWGPDGTILFQRLGQLSAVSATGGPVTSVATVDQSGRPVGAGWPSLLPDGRRFIFFDSSPGPERGIYAGSLDSAETTFLLRSDVRAWYAPPGYLLFLRGETLMAQPFDPVRLELRGEPVPVAEGIWTARTVGQASFSVSETAIAYVNASLWDVELAWYDQEGRPLGTLAPPGRFFHPPDISPDARRVAVRRGEIGLTDLWVLETDGGVPARLTFTPEGEGPGVWAAGGGRLMYTSGSRLLVMDVDEGTEEDLGPAPGEIADWSSDGRFAVFQRLDGAGLDLWVLELGSDRAAFLFEDTPFHESQAQISPDGNWIAYTSNETGRDEVYMQSFPVAGRKRQLSTNGGAMPRWRGDGETLFYAAADQFLTAVSFRRDAGLTVRESRPLFRTRLVVQGSEAGGVPTAYDVTPDGQRFLFRYPPIDPGPPITVVLNWAAALGR